MFSVFFGAFLSALTLIFDGIVHEAGFSPSELAKIIDAETLRAPFFREIRGRLSYVQGRVRSDELVERKRLVEERCAELKKFALQRANEQSELNSLVRRYGESLAALSEDGGVLRLFFAGFDIESLVRVKAAAPPDPERNRPLDADYLFVIRSMMVAHAALISLFNDVEELAHELDHYSEQLTAIQTLGDRIFDPVLDELVKEKDIFDEGTLELTANVRRLDEQEGRLGLAPTRQSVGTKHGWVRAALGAIARVALANAGKVANIIKDAAIKEIVSTAVRNPTTLVASVTLFLVGARSALLYLAERLPAAFGWIRSLLSIIGLSM